ncbi:MAG: hypothetical protein J6D35_02135 [Chryseobacterium sp.]|nr:hypothetical protein [Chryseobacterium sp.]
MKNVFFLSLLIFFALLSCRNDEAGVQKIDQIIRLYIDSAGQDMLNSNIQGGYTNIRMNDVYGLTDSAPVNFSTKKDQDTLSYIEYIAGARRIGIDSTGNTKTYESRIALSFTKRLTDSTTATINDTMTVHYNFTPEIFRVSKVWYNKVLQFTKVADEPNIVKIQK